MGDKKDLKVPKHIGFIMDGNRRWAKKRGLPTFEGHRRGYSAVNNLIENCLKRGIKHVTVYAFSTENWNRSAEEVNYLMDIFREMFKKFQKKFEKLGVKVNVAGRLIDFPEDVRQLAIKAALSTKDNKKMHFNVAFSYGGRAEIIDATKRIVSEGLKPEKITEEKFSE